MFYQVYNYRCPDIHTLADLLNIQIGRKIRKLKKYIQEFKIYNNDETNPLSYTNKTKQVCIIDKDTIGTGADFQEAMKNGKTKCFHTSMSAGDIVSVNGVTYLCQNFGWEVLK